MERDQPAIGPQISRRTMTRGALFGALAVGSGLLGGTAADAAPSASATTSSAPTGPNWGLTKFLDPLRVPSLVRPHGQDLQIWMTQSQVRLHSQLPPTTAWTYNGQMPGPTIEVDSGREVHVTWSNQIEGTMPLIAVQALVSSNPTNVPGYRDPSGALRPGHTMIDGVTDLPAWTVTHLHGAPSNGNSDGWPHNGILKGSAQLSQYQNLLPSTALFYHDHAMAITRFNFHMGLTGMYIVRDHEEQALNLPRGEHEIPLILCDRNVDTDPATGELNGNLLYKVPAVPYLDGLVPAGFTGPFNTVNGTIWPHLDVQPRWYRFRLLNVSNGRVYTLNLVDDAGTVHNDAIKLIGTDGGLLPVAAPVPAAGLTISTAERMDLLIDFSAFKGKNLRLTDSRTAAGPTEPDLMQFRVAPNGLPDPFKLPARLSPSYVRLSEGTTVPKDHDVVWVGLVMNQMGHPEMWDMQEVDTDPGGPGVLQIVDPDTGRTRTFRKMGAMFDDTVSVYINHNRWAVWHFLHVTPIGPVHPMHVHLARLQALSRRSFTTTFDLPSSRTTKPIAGFKDVPLEKWEEGWKDTFLVNRGEWVTIAGKFEGGTGEFMFHCHIVDHEDDNMMRPFVVHPPEVAKFDKSMGGM